jgi:hypothetical protein
MKITEIVHDAQPDIMECLECMFNDIIDVSQFCRQPKRRKVDRGKGGNTSPFWDRAHRRNWIFWREQIHKRGVVSGA